MQIHGVLFVTMEAKELLHEVHHRIEARERASISQAAMAQRIGISPRTYVEYLRGTNSPLAMKALLRLLTQLGDEEIVQVVRGWQTVGTSRKRHPKKG